MAAMFGRKPTSQESSTGPWWGLALAYLVGVIVYVSLMTLLFGETFWIALIGGAFVIAFALGGVVWTARRKSAIGRK